MQRLIIGSKPIDRGNYIFNAEQRANLLKKEPDAAQFLRPYVSAREFLQKASAGFLLFVMLRPKS